MLLPEKDTTEQSLREFKAALVAGDVFDYTDTNTGMYVKVSYCKDRQKIRIEKTVPDTSPILHANEEMLAHNRRDWKGDYHYVGRVPVLAQANYCQSRGITQREFMQDPNEFKRMLNDKDNQALRIKKGVL